MLSNNPNVSTNENSKQQSTHSAKNSRSLLDSLREGGYIFYARHAEATVGVDQPNLNFYDCATQRNLSDRGREQAVTYGENLRRLNIPVRLPVPTSPFCRNVETTQLAFEEENVQIDPFWVDIYMLSAPIGQWEQSRILNTLQVVLQSLPEPGTNTVIIGHSFPRGVGLGRIPNMGTVIIRPYGQGRGFEIVDRLTLNDFTALSD